MRRLDGFVMKMLFSITLKYECLNLHGYQVPLVVSVHSVGGNFVT